MEIIYTFLTLKNTDNLRTYFCLIREIIIHSLHHRIQWDHRPYNPGLGLQEKYDQGAVGGGGGRSESLRISFLEAVYGLRVSFLSLYNVLGYEFDVIAASGAVCAFYWNNCFENVGKKRDCFFYCELYL